MWRRGVLCLVQAQGQRQVKTIDLLLTLAEGPAGVGVGFLGVQIAYPEGVRNVRFVANGDLKSPAVFTYIVGATALSSVLGGLYDAFRLLRYNEVWVVFP